MLRSRFEAVPWAFSRVFLTGRFKDVTEDMDMVLHFMFNISEVLTDFDMIPKILHNIVTS